jgi:hypothetical protein
MKGATNGNNDRQAVAFGVANGDLVRREGSQIEISQRSWNGSRGSSKVHKCFAARQKEEADVRRQKSEKAKEEGRRVKLGYSNKLPPLVIGVALAEPF